MKLSRILLLLLLVLSLSSCINTPLPDYYVLTAEGETVSPSDALVLTRDAALGIGPVTIPETINRPNIVTPLDSNQLDVAEYHRWSEPLVDNISRVLITNLAAETRLNKLYAYPWLGNYIDYQIRIDVLQMIGRPNERVRLQVRWQILDGDKPARLITTQISDYTALVTDKGYSAMVAAYSSLFARLSGEISQTLYKIEKADS